MASFMRGSETSGNVGSAVASAGASIGREIMKLFGLEEQPALTAAEEAAAKALVESWGTNQQAEATEAFYAALTAPAARHIVRDADKAVNDLLLAKVQAAVNAAKAQAAAITSEENFLDDIVISSYSLEDHVDHLRRLLEQLKENRFSKDSREILVSALKEQYQNKSYEELTEIISAVAEAAPAAAAAAAAPAAPAAAKKNATYYKEAEDFMKKIYPFINKECITILDGCFDKYWSINPNIIRDLSTAMWTVMFLYKEIKKYLEETNTFKGKSFKDGRNYLEMEATFGIDVCTSYLHFFVNNNDVFEFQHRLVRAREHIEDLHLYLISLTDLMMRSWENVLYLQDLEDVESHFHDDIHGMGPMSMAKREDTTESKVLTNMTAMARIILLTCESSSNKYAENLVKPYDAPFIEELSKILFKNGFEEDYYTTEWAEAGYQKILSLDDAPTMIKVPVAKMGGTAADFKTSACISPRWHIATSFC